MSNTNPSPERERNARTWEAHRRDVFWQITIPLVIILLVILGLMVLTVVAATGSGPTAQAGDAALIFLIIPLMAMALISLILFSGIAYGLIRLNRALPFYTKPVQDTLYMVRDRINHGADKVTKPFLKVHGLIASAKAIRKKTP
ncbi:MAG TPA: hypothetical protein EYP88_05915 [Anaerolineales bacterium]|nr:hypothetical protein [Anaerolineales bacterium]